MFSPSNTTSMICLTNENELRVLYSSLLNYLDMLEADPDRVGPEIELVRDMRVAVRELLSTTQEHAV